MNNPLGPENEDEVGLAHAARDQLAALRADHDEMPAPNAQPPVENAARPDDPILLREYVDVELIRRETRLIPVFINLWTHFRFRGARTDQRSRAAVTAFLWRIFSPGAAAATAGAALLLLGTFLQVFLIAQQNEKLDQTHVMQAQANVPLISQLAPLSDELTRYASETCLASRDRIKPTDLENCWLGVSPTDRARWLSCWDGNNCVDHERFAKEYPANASPYLFPETLELPPELQFRIVLLTLAARPYRFVDDRQNEPEGVRPGFVTSIWRRLQESAGGGLAPTRLVDRPLSPERGALLRHLIGLGYQVNRGEMTSADFSSAYAKGFYASNDAPDYLAYVSMPFAIFEKAPKLLHKSDFECGTFEGADMFESEITGGKYIRTVFKQVTLPRIDRFNPADLTGATFESVLVKESDFLERLADKRIEGFDPTLWQQVILAKDSYTIGVKEGRLIPPRLCEGQ